MWHLVLIVLAYYLLLPYFYYYHIFFDSFTTGTTPAKSVQNEGLYYCNVKKSTLTHLVLETLKVFDYPSTEATLHASGTYHLLRHFKFQKKGFI